MLIDARFEKNNSLYLRIRNLNTYWDFIGLTWVVLESNNTKAALTEYNDSSPTESYYAVNINPPPNGPWPVEIIESVSGDVIFRGNTDVPVSSRLASSSYIAPDNNSLNEIKEEASLARKLQSNKAVISSDGLFVTIYDDDQTTILYEYNISADQKIRTPI